MDERESIVLSYQRAFRLLLHLKNVIAASKQVSAEDELLKEVYRDSIVKKYEILEDQLWKLLSRIFKASGLELNNPRACYRQAFKEGWIQNIDVWNDILHSRNAAAHVYNEEDYEQIKNRIVSQYVHEIEALLKYIKKEVIDRDLWNEPDRV
ncbi:MULTISPECIES: HI0074 family nucleotidyltransferase substrate-binding subunit [Geobacillus]|uniref:Nucleotidyltransferase substrate binding protein n=1 Tax=Geobacillus zalihae TaxID=213419 RepID=A0A7H1SGB3_9BACL|nr:MULTISPECIES: HI0074 family nucleotidyltransferase substrate-binding subunit [Geobacillus]ATA60584.1 nucleotidyltransferase [Geobacillus stearothermophilus]KZM58112.1 nucleotidyltransferase [Geobacillus stearothermophilus]MCG6795469.1 nucleotidyltransferase substrate binding protein [Geobacillus sp. YHL]PJW15431.1 nucleotidyltransferase [Geobacillus sp. Manikaran-105]PJW18509.1 nucleotidyltransferase [Geobacillus sp. WSUCF-018B]